MQRSSAASHRLSPLPSRAPVESAHTRARPISLQQWSTRALGARLTCKRRSARRDNDEVCRGTSVVESRHRLVSTCCISDGSRCTPFAVPLRRLTASSVRPSSCWPTAFNHPRQPHGERRHAVSRWALVSHTCRAPEPQHCRPARPCRRRSLAGRARLRRPSRSREARPRETAPTASCG